MTKDDPYVESWDRASRESWSSVVIRHNDGSIEELTLGRAADLIERQRRQIADLKDRLSESEERLSHARWSLQQSKAEAAHYSEEALRLQSKLKAEERAERTRAQRVQPVRLRRRIES